MKRIITILVVLLICAGANAQSEVEVTATSGTTGPTMYATLKAAFDKINDGTHQGAITIKINGNTTESLSAILYQSGYNPPGKSDPQSNYTSVNIYPTVTGLTISGDLAAPLIDLNGADHVTIDGRVNATGSTKDLLITNTQIYYAASVSTIRFINAAANDTVKYCTVKGSSADQSSGGVLLFSTASSGLGNSNNAITNCNITNAEGNRPFYAINSVGSPGYENSNNTISNNNIFDFLNSSANSCGIFISNNSTSWNVTGNSLYETTPITGSYGWGIYISNISGNNFTISGNFIGGNAANCGGSALTIGSNANQFYGIHLNVGTASASNIQGNTIKNFAITSTVDPFYGIYLESGAVNVGTSIGNTIGATTGTGSIMLTNTTADATSYGIYINSAGTFDIENNNIGAITTVGSATIAHSFTGIFDGSSVMNTISNNTIGSATTPNSIQASSSGTSAAAQNVYGIYCQGTGTVAISGNTIANMSNAYASTSVTGGQIIGVLSTICSGSNTITNNTVRDLTIANANNAGTYQASVGGIVLNNTTAAAQTITDNTIYNLSNTYASFGGSVIGLYYSGSTTASAVSGNFIHSLSVTGASSTTASIYGIKINAGATTYSNNIISLGGNTATTIYGIYETGAESNDNNLYFNTVYIGGTVASLTIKSYALYSAVNTNTREIRNNIFNNARAFNNPIKTASTHFAAYFAATGGTLTCDYNDYYAAGTSGVLGYYGGYKTTLPIVTGQDAHSLNTNPSFASAGGTAALNYITSASLPGVAGTGITIDYAGTTRSATPTMGAYELAPASATWTGSESTDWNTPGNWSSSSVPFTTSDVTIPVTITDGVTYDPIVNQSSGTPAECKNLTIDLGAVLTIAPGKALTVNGTLTNSAGTAGLVIQSSAAGTGSLIHATNNVNATIQRYTTGSTDLTVFKYHFVSVPLTAAAAPTSNLFLGSYLENFSESTNSWVSMGASTTNSLDVTRGYMIYYPESSTTYSFAGPMNNGSFTALTSYSTGNGYNLVPNPYPSAIDWDAASGWTKTHIDNAVYIWPSNAGSGATATNYASYVNSVSINSGSRYISTGQSFFVHANATSPVLTMDNRVRLHNAVSFLKDAEIINNILRIHSVANNSDDEIVVRFTEAATTGFDGDWDAYKMQGGTEAPQLSSVASDNSNLSINSLPFSAGNVTVPLNFSLNTCADVTFTASSMESFTNNIPIYLEDLTLSKMVNLRQNPVYTFKYETGSAIDRFMVHFAGPIGTEELSANTGKAFISNGRLFIEVPGMKGQIADIRVYNSLGQLLSADKVMMNDIVRVDAPLNTGVFMVYVATSNQHFVTKVFNK